MSGDLPNFLDLNGLGGTSAVFAGRLEIKQLARLCESARADGYADVQLQAVAEQGQRLVNGQVRAELELTCQRCLGPMQYPVAVDIKLMWARTRGEATRLPEGYDSIISASGMVSVAELVENELLLALPMVARHALPDECATRFLPSASRRSVSADEGAPGPFAVLKTFKRH